MEPKSLGDILREAFKDIERLSEYLHECKFCGCSNTEEELFINENKCVNCNANLKEI